MARISFSAGATILYGVAASIGALLTLAPVPLLKALDRFEQSLPVITRDDLRLRQSIRVTDRDGNLLFKTYDDEDRIFVSLDRIPPVVRDAFIAIEDERFYKRPCIDGQAILRAAYRTYVLKERQGGSTISQQLVRSITGERDITVTRKIREIAVACSLERSIGKNAVLEQYLNRINFGGTLYGVQRASEEYFGIPVWELDAAQAAVLAAIIQKPSYYASGGRLAGAPGRAQDVLSAMKRLGFIGSDAYRVAMTELADLSFERYGQAARPPYPFISLVVKRSQRVLDELDHGRALTYSGLTITTTLDLRVQKATESAIQDTFPAISERTYARDVAAVVLDRRNRDIVGYIGNMDWGGNPDTYWVDMAASPRQLGSAFKPIVYASYMENGHTPDTITSDWPITIGSIRPRNFEGGFLGRMTIRKALAYSRNIPAIRAFIEVGEDRVLQLASAMGAPTPLQERDERRETNPRFSYGWPTAIGAAELPLFELVQAYGTLAEGGVSDATHTITRIAASDGRTVYEPPVTVRWQILHPESADAVADILSDWNARPERWNEVIELPREWNVALKTGTSNICRRRKLDGNCASYGVLNTVAVGFTDRYVIGVLVANADNTLLHPQADGLTAAVPVWTAIIRNLAETQE